MRAGIYIFLILTTLQWGLVLTYASEQPQSKISKVTVRVVPPEQPIATERVVLKVKIRNVSDKAINLPWPKYINQFMNTESTVQDADALIVKHAGLSLGHGKYPGGLLKPGEEMTAELWHIFLDAGTYTFKCVLDTTVLKGYNIWGVWEGRVESRSIVINIKKRPKI